MNTKNSTDINVGIDTSKSSLDFHTLPSNKAFQVTNNQAGVDKAIARLIKLNPTRIVIEATGRMEKLFVRACVQAQLPVIVVNPLYTRRFATAFGIIAKTDAIDAMAIALFAERIRPDVRLINDEDSQFINDLLVRRQQLSDMCAMEKNRSSIMPKAVLASINDMIKHLKQEQKSIEAQLDQAIKANTQWSEKLELIKSTPGVGLITAYPYSDNYLS